MFDRVLTILLLLGLITCPVRCALGSFEVDSNGSRVASVVCSCCQHHSSEGDQQRPTESPQPDEKDCGCSDCLCDGAVSEVSGQRAWGDSVSDDLFARPISLAAASGGISTSATVSGWLRETPAGWCCSGRQTRIAHQSFLI